MSKEDFVVITLLSYKYMSKQYYWKLLGSMISIKSSSSLKSSGRCCLDVFRKSMPVVHHSACCCHLYVIRSRDVFVHSGRTYGRTDGVRGGRTYGRPSDSFSSLWADFSLTVHINALHNESRDTWKGRTCNLN